MIVAVALTYTSSRYGDADLPEASGACPSRLWLVVAQANGHSHQRVLTPGVAQPFEYTCDPVVGRYFYSRDSRH